MVAHRLFKPTSSTIDSFFLSSFPCFHHHQDAVDSTMAQLIPLSLAAVTPGSSNTVQREKSHVERLNKLCSLLDIEPVSAMVEPSARKWAGWLQICLRRVSVANTRPRRFMPSSSSLLVLSILLSSRTIGLFALDIFDPSAAQWYP